MYKSNTYNEFSRNYTLFHFCAAFVVFERQTIEVFGWFSLSMLLNFLEKEAFVGEIFVLGEISFLILLSFCIDIRYLLSSNPKNIYFYREFPWKQTFPRLAN